MLVICEKLLLSLAAIAVYTAFQNPTPPPHPPVVSESNRAQQGATGSWYTEGKQTKDQKWIRLHVQNTY